MTQDLETYRASGAGSGITTSDALDVLRLMRQNLEGALSKRMRLERWALTAAIDFIEKELRK
jgi:hypothetical protein